MWSKTKKQLEGVICDSLQERVEFHCSNYRIIENEDAIIQYFYRLRCDAEEIY